MTGLSVKHHSYNDTRLAIVGEAQPYIQENFFFTDHVLLG